MGAIKELVTEIEERMNPTGGQVVLYLDNHGWYGWTTAKFWDDNHHTHYQQTRQEIGRFDGLCELLAARDAFNQMMHGKTNRTIY
jgi:hypothetical protein